MRIKIIHMENDVLEDKVNEFLASIDSPEYEVENISFQFGERKSVCVIQYETDDWEDVED